MASQTNRINYSVLPWYTAQKFQNALTQQRLGYGNGVPYCLPAEQYHLPPFQIVRTTDISDPIIEFKLINYESGQEYDILAAITAAGLVVENYTTYDIIMCPGTSAMTGLVIPLGIYWAKIRTNALTWYSDVFEWFTEAAIEKMVKVSFWHDARFALPIGHISYVEPFYNYIYFPTQINKPRFENDNIYEKNDGYQFPIYMISQVKFHFFWIVPEYLAHVIRIIEHHHYKTIEFDEVLYDPIFFEADIAEESEDQGHVWRVNFFFELDTVVTTTGKIKVEDEGNEYDQSEYDNSEFD